MNKKTRNYAIVAMIVVVGIFSVFGVPPIFSVATGIPYWFLRLPLSPFSILPSERSMHMEVNPSIPTTLGETITVRIIDAENGSLLEGVLIRALKDGLSINKTTNFSGIATFENMGATTVIYASKEGYADAEPKVIPAIPDEWVTTRNATYVTQALMLLGLVVSILTLSKKTASKASGKTGKSAPKKTRIARQFAP